MMIEIKGFILILVLALLSFIVVKFIRRLWTLHCIKVRYPKDFPFVVELFYPLFKIAISSAEDRFRIIGDYCTRFPGMVKLWFGPKLVVCINDPELIKNVVMSQKCLEKWNLLYALMERDNGLISASAKQHWKLHRKFFNSSFSRKVLDTFLPIFADHSDSLCENLEQKIDGEEFDFFSHSKKFSFDILCATLLGIDMKDYKTKSLYEKIFIAYETTELAMNQKFTIPFLYPQTFYKFTAMFREERKAQKVLNDFQRDVLKERSQNANRDVSNDEENSQQILIDQILRNEEKFTSDEIRDHVLTFVSGYETWANALAHAMLLLAIHPEIQQKLFDEIEKVTKSDDDFKDSELINNIEYLDMVQNEVFRLMPSVPIIFRETLEDFEIKHGLIIPKEVNLVINFYALHRRKDIWGDDADQFNPERFTKENSKSRHPFAFLPFSSGSRICIGFKYSNISLKIAIIKLLKHFSFHTSMELKDIRLKSYISLKLCTKHLMSVVRRRNS